MKVYWDASALIWFYARGRVAEIEGVTRSHALAEVFSALSGKGVLWQMMDGTYRLRKLSPGLASKVVETLHKQLDFVEVRAEDVVKALKHTQTKGVQGGRVHDYLHMIAAQSAGADELWTADENDFTGLGKVKVRQVAEIISS
jgi:predicted nucleic acid-binding protein